MKGYAVLSGLWYLGRIWILIIKYNLTSMFGVLGTQYEWYRWDTPSDTAVSEKGKVPAFKLLVFTSWWWDKEGGCAGWGHSMNKVHPEERARCGWNKTDQNRWLCSAAQERRVESHLHSQRRGQMQWLEPGKPLVLPANGFYLMHGH